MVAPNGTLYAYQTPAFGGNNGPAYFGAVNPSTGVFTPLVNLNTEFSTENGGCVLGFDSQGDLLAAGYPKSGGGAYVFGTYNLSNGAFNLVTSGTQVQTFYQYGQAFATLPTFTSTQYLPGLNISSGTRDTLVGNGNGHRSMLYTTSLSDAGTLDLTANDLDLQNGGPMALSAVTALVAQGYSNGTWLGTGITSSAAASDPSHLTALGVILNTAGGSTPIYTTLDSATVAVNDVLVKYTYYGDCNLDGKGGRLRLQPNRRRLSG